MLIATIGQTIFKLLLSVMAVFLILLVLVQRGRGGGLAGALGGMGGSSAFGAKAGDVFTRVTIVAAALWIVLCIAAAKLAPTSDESRINTGLTAPASQPAGGAAETSSGEKPADGETASQEAAPAATTAPAESDDPDNGDR
jgi:preprotein translocase subunit SecG